MLKSFSIGAAYSAFIVALLCAGAADAQAQTPDSAFQDVLDNPTDPEAMLAYARRAVEDRDYERVVSTLERLLDIEPGHVEARYELAVAYYALGSYEVAEFHFRLVQELDPQGARSRDVAVYLDRVDARTAANAVAGFVAFGVTSTDDGAAANLNAALRWSADLGGAFDNTWTTDLRLGLYSGDAGLDTSRFSIRTGPNLSVNGLAFGVRVQPFVEAVHVDDNDDDASFTALNLGARLLNTHSRYWSTFADIKVGRLVGDLDGDTWSVLGGAAYTPSRDTRLRFVLAASNRGADDPNENRDRRTARVELQHAFARAGRGSGRRWVGSAFAQFDALDYDSGREDRLTSVGVALRAFVNNDVFVELGARNISRNSTIDRLDESTPLFSILVGREF